MKYLSDYMKDATTQLYAAKGAFFAFSAAQLEEKRVPGVEYSTLSTGLIVPVGNELAVWDGYETIYKNAIAMDIAENGKDAIIRRELFNHECFYDCEVARAIDALADYKFPREDIVAAYQHILTTEDTD